LQGFRIDRARRRQARTRVPEWSKSTETIPLHPIRVASDATGRTTDPTHGPSLGVREKLAHNHQLKPRLTQHFV
jgi:hypothetical protein